MKDIRIAWWNLENGFDHENARRPPELKSQLKSELRGWSAAVRDRKIRRLAEIVQRMFDGSGPDLLGVCEIENENVLSLLARSIQIPGRAYGIVSHPSHDARGIDVSFIVDENILTPGDKGHQVVIKRTATRDIFWVGLSVKGTDAAFVAVGNHWPARSAGRYASEPFRMLTGETLSVVLHDLFASSPQKTKRPVLLMGDFNDEPFDRSMREYLLGSRDPGRVKGAQTPRVLNLMWPILHGDDPGSYKYGSDWFMFDQFLASKGLLLKNSRVRVKEGSVGIFKPDEMVGSGGAPIRFGRPSKGDLNEQGCSDHFPIVLTLRVK